jgi:S1-C subfamily serine protease
MLRPLAALGCCLLLTPARAADPAESVVRIYATVRDANPLRPWTTTPPVELAGTGTVIDGKRILTNAHLVVGATEVSVQGRPGEDKFEAKVAAVGPEIDLAVLTVKDEKFFERRPALPLAKGLPKPQDPVAVYGFPIGGDNLSVTKGVVSRVEAMMYHYRGYGVGIQVSAALNPGNSGGPAVVEGKGVGLVYSRLAEGENIGYVIPTEEIDQFLDDVKDGRYDGKPKDQTRIRFQTLQNDALRASLRLDPGVRGILVIPRGQRDALAPFRELDVATKVGGYEIDAEGMVRRADGLRVPFWTLFPQLAKDGAVPFTVIRDGKPITLAVPVSTADHRLVRDLNGGKLPYFIHGPLVFAPATSLGLAAYTRARRGIELTESYRRFNDRTAFPGEELVVVTSPLFAHKIAKGYADPLGQAVASVNRVPVKNLRHLVELLRDAKGEFVTIQYVEEVEMMVFRREEMDAATADILEENGIAPARRGSEEVLAVWKTKPVAK